MMTWMSGYVSRVCLNRSMPLLPGMTTSTTMTSNSCSSRSSKASGTFSAVCRSWPSFSMNNPRTSLMLSSSSTTRTRAISLTPWFHNCKSGITHFSHRWERHRVFTRFCRESLQYMLCGTFRHALLTHGRRTNPRTACGASRISARWLWGRVRGGYGVVVRCMHRVMRAEPIGEDEGATAIKES